MMQQMYETSFYPTSIGTLTHNPKKQEKFHSEITQRVLPLLQDSESMIRMWSVRILSRTNRRNIRYLQQWKRRLDIKLK